MEKWSTGKLHLNGGFVELLKSKDNKKRYFFICKEDLRNYVGIPKNTRNIEIEFSEEPTCKDCFKIELHSKYEIIIDNTYKETIYWPVYELLYEYYGLKPFYARVYYW